VPILDVEDIESLNPELHLEPLTDRNGLEHRKVQVINRWAPESIARQVAERTGVVWHSERAWIKPTHDRVGLIGCAATLRNCLLTIRIRVGCHGTGCKRIGDDVWPQVVVRCA